MHTFHGLRHDCASLLLAQGVPVWAVSKILGHCGIQITANVYGHLAPELQLEAAERMDSVLNTAARWPTAGSRTRGGARRGSPARTRRF